MAKRLRAYYPESSITKNLLTNGKEWMSVDYKEYFGFYHTYSNGEVFSLADWNEKLSVKLIPYDQHLIDQILTTTSYKKNDIYNPKRYVAPKETIISPELKHFKEQGMWNRFFIQKVNDLGWGIREISEEQYKKTKSRNQNDIDSFLFKSIKIPWKLTGNINDTYKDNILIGGVYDTNLRTIKTYNETFKGLSKYLTDPLEFTQYSKWYTNFIMNFKN